VSATAKLEAAILDLLARRAPGKTICPSEAAKHVGGTESPDAWRALMPAARAAAQRLAEAGRIDITQHGHPIDLATAKGPIRLRLR
jgi:nucleoid-associated protein YgaU